MHLTRGDFYCSGVITTEGKLKPPEYKSSSQTQGKAELGKPRGNHWKSKDWGDGNGHKWLHELQQARKEQQSAALKGLCPAGGAGTELLMVVFHYSEEKLELECPIWDWPEPGAKPWQLKLYMAVVNGVKTVQLGWKRGAKRCFHLTGRCFQG